ncbi:MAG: biotin transporter BioY [Pseudomonadota bacterium]
MSEETMITGHTARPPLARVARLAALLAGGSLVMVACAKTTVPFWPVPMTMQVFGAFLLAALAGGRLAAGMILVYLIEGALGLPVFAGTAGGGAGLAALFGPTGGYLAGFAIAALVAGEWMRRTQARGGGAALAPMLAGLGVIYLCGALWLVPFVGWHKVLAVGVTPFLVGDLLKVLLAAVTAAVLLRWKEAA